MTAARPKRAKRTPSKSAPDLSPIIDTLSDAYGLVWTANQVITQGVHYGPEQGVLRQGVEALERVLKQLDEAALQLAQFHKANNCAEASPVVLSKAALAHGKKIAGNRKLATEFLKKEGFIERPGKLHRNYR